jgi:hypothetical protein
MDAQLLETMVGRYLAVWNESDPTVRRELLEAVFAEKGTYTDPISKAENRSELDAMIGRFREDNPGAVFALEGKIESHHGYARFYWLLSFANGAQISGMDYAEVSPEGTIHKIVGFF